MSWLRLETVFSRLEELDEVRKTKLWLRRVHWGWKELFDVGKNLLR